MFENPNTLWLEILVLVLVAVFLLGMLGIYVYKKSKGLPTGDCACCSHSKSKLVKQYHKYYSKNN